LVKVSAANSTVQQMNRDIATRRIDPSQLCIQNAPDRAKDQQNKLFGS